MREEVKLNIHYGGAIEKKDETFEYVGENVLCRSVFWSLPEIEWNKFEDFIREQKVLTQIGLIWFKVANEGMEKLQYAFDSLEGGVSIMRESGKKEGKIDVYIEHECSEILLKNEVLGLISSKGEEKGDKEDERDNGDESDKAGESDKADESDQGYDSEKYDAEDESGGSSGNESEEEEETDEEAEAKEECTDEEDSDNEEIPKDDMDVEVSENEIADGIEKKQATEVDDGEDVVPEVGDAASDDCFTTLFEEAENVEDGVREQPARNETIREEDYGEESGEIEYEFGLGEEPYPDTPLDTDGEWEKLKEKPKRREKCKWKVFCSVEVPINKWMVKVCHDHHNHPKDGRVRLLKQGVIASLYREELRRRVYMTANEIKDSIKEKYNCIVSRFKCSKARRIALDVVLEDQATQFAKLWDYESELRRSNPGITTEIGTIPLRGIPCKHVVCVINDNKEDVTNYVGQYYNTNMWKGTYVENIKPVNGEKLWKKTGRIPIGVPDFRRPPGRPKNHKRKRDPYESPSKKGKATRHGRTMHCSNCGEANHNKAKCKNEAKVLQPKNKRGRPRKHPQEVPVQRPPRSAVVNNPTKKPSKSAVANNPTKKHSTSATKKPKKAASKKNNSTVSSSQPTHLGESSTSLFPAASSAPQPSVSSNQPHVKKPRRGRPLKVKKSIQISPGYVVLNRPYTGRVFDIWGSRVHEISGTSTQQPPPAPP